MKESMALIDADAELYVDEDERENGSRMKWSGILSQRRKCRCLYRTKGSFDSHKERCDGVSVKQDRTVMNRAA